MSCHPIRIVHVHVRAILIALSKFWAEHALRARARQFMRVHAQATSMQLLLPVLGCTAQLALRLGISMICIMRACLVYLLLILVTVVDGIQLPWR
jgi:hypothetical protein